MKMVINSNWGGFEVPMAVQQELRCGRFSDTNDIRMDPRFVEWVERHPNSSDLRVVEIPDNATDWEMDEYDGLETIIAVVDGKIVHL